MDTQQWQTSNDNGRADSSLKPFFRDLFDW